MAQHILQIRLYGDPCLRRKATLVKEVGPSERMLIQMMLDTMHAHKGIGLAAPQVGVNQRIFVVDVGEGPHVFVNPAILKRSGDQNMEEGCLSIPEVNIKVKRPLKIVVKFNNENNVTLERAFDQLMARVILHENDHLNGKLIIDYASISEKMRLKPKLKQIKAQQKKEV